MITKATLKALKRRNTAWIRFKQFESGINYCKYKKLRNEVVRRIREDKTDYQRRLRGHLKTVQNNFMDTLGRIDSANRSWKSEEAIR